MGAETTAVATTAAATTEANGSKVGNFLNKNKDILTRALDLVGTTVTGMLDYRAAKTNANADKLTAAAQERVAELQAEQAKYLASGSKKSSDGEKSNNNTIIIVAVVVVLLIAGFMFYTKK